MTISSACLLKVGVVGLNHKTSDLAFREAMAKAADALAGQKALFFPHPTILLSTCNRTEIYFSAEHLADAHSDLLLLLRRFLEGSFEHRLYSYFGIDCFFHLAKVASGLDSAILAESEIQRQVKVAYEISKKLFSIPSCLHFIFQKALRVGKEIRSMPLFEKGAPSLFSAIWELTERFSPDLDSKKVLFVGFSELNRTLAAQFSRKKMNFLAFASRDPAAVVAAGYTAYDRSILAQWNGFDIVICASKAHEFLIDGRSDRDHLIFDLSVPRNVNPQISLPLKSKIYNIEQLNRLIDKKQKDRREVLMQHEQFVRDYVLRLARMYRENRLHPLSTFASR